MTAEAHAHVCFKRAIDRGALWAAEDAARELPNLSLDNALKLVHLYAELESPAPQSGQQKATGASATAAGSPI